MLTIIDKKDEIKSLKKELIESLQNPGTSIYIMGRNNYSTIVIKQLIEEGIQINGVIDDTNKSVSSFMGIDVCRTDQVPRNSTVICCVIEGRLHSALKRLKLSDISGILTYFDLYLFDEEKYPAPIFFGGNVIDIENNQEEYHWLASILDDQVSLDTLERLIDFRFNCNVEAMSGFTYRVDQQYFDQIVLKDEDEVFVDCGGYDGQTTLKFINEHPGYKSAYVLEPSPELYENIKTIMAPYPRVKVLPYAAYREDCELLFDSTMDSASSISVQGNVNVSGAKLDTLIDGPITFLKFDVEGAELDALIGSENIIRSYKPKIAVCVYHDQSHFWKIPRLILKYCSEYKVSLRHYTEGTFETVMYFY
ncbi:FkbM family methyltransferase [Paenibacillus sp. J22TS3]|uniref:FkbM family methyltransferase n=1 Tax=Paenibacillus sp. J22TS3 TaxID=2807192 RepID=UPI001B07FC9A|nr:FkbM family methyltransferase [Paenibacillus sp. J22TS3]GIP21748.1 hypothetical protein J22TS3_20230 [Paenibacillus sp. J22TS3]